MQHEITYSFPNFNSEAVEIWERINNFISHFTEHVIIYSCWDLSYVMSVKGPATMIFDCEHTGT